MGRNVAGKSGPKGKTAVERAAEADELGLREQWDFYYAEWRRLCAVVTSRGRVFTDRYGQPKDRPEVMMRDRAASHLLSVSKTLADLGALDPVESELAVVLDFQQTRKAAAGG